MRSIVRATAVLGTSSLVGLVLGLVSSKVLAELVGPIGIGHMGLLQGLLGLATIVASMGIGPALVRSGALALARGDRPRFAALGRASWWMAGILSVCALACFALLREPIATVMLGGSDHGRSAALVGIALVFALLATVQTSILNARQRVGALARASMTSSVVGTIVTLALVTAFREHGIVWAVVATSAGGWIVATYYLRRDPDTGGSRPSAAEISVAARELLRFGGPYTASMLVGTGVQFALPAIVLHTLGTEDVGYYRAATSISVGYLGVLTTAMAQDYYPRVSAAGDSTEALVRIVNEQHKLVMLIAIPAILGVLALAPYIVRFTYSTQFAPTVDILEWQLIGDIFRFSSWTMAFVVLARSGSSAFFGIELFGGFCSLTANWLGMRWLGLTGLGVGFLVTYVLYYLIVFLILQRSIRLRWTSLNLLLMIGAMLSVGLVQTLPHVGLSGSRTQAALALALTWASGGAYALWREMAPRRGSEGPT
jgi:enterobacterial common antigen flippase